VAKRTFSYRAAFAVAAGLVVSPLSHAATVSQSSAVTAGHASEPLGRVVREAALHAPDTQAMVLTRHDLPDVLYGFHVVDRRVVDNRRFAQELGVPLAAVIVTGRLSGFRALYYENVEHASGSRVLVGVGVNDVSSVVDLYRSARLAHTRFSLVISTTKGIQALAIHARLGQEARVYMGTISIPFLPGRSETSYYIFWRDGPVFAVTAVAGLAGFKLRDALMLARVQESKIDRVLHG
jgi:hypothetical protein